MTRAYVVAARELLGLATPPEELPSWEWFDPRHGERRWLTHEMLGDPAVGRSALDGWQQMGGAYWEGHSAEYHAEYYDGMAAGRIERSGPWALDGKISWPRVRPKLSKVAGEVAKLRGCRFPVGPLESPDFHFCNEARRDGSSYCAEHAAVCEMRRR